ncbi:MAG: helix-turn-helix domain-containing protein [Patescibacteria group bacterium]
MDKDFSTLFNDKIRECGLTLRRVSELSGIAMDHLENLSRGEYGNLPPAPYLRGYLSRLAHILEFDTEEWWSVLEESAGLKKSGERDRLPENRFALRPTRRYGWIIAVIVIVAIYVGWRLPQILGRPELQIYYPAEPAITVEEETITISGRAVGSDAVYINSEQVRLNPDGSWEKRVALTPAVNMIEISAKKFLGGETKVIKQVIRNLKPADGTAPVQ